MEAQDFLTYIDESKAKNTAKSYRNGLKHFAEWYKKSSSAVALNEILQDRAASLKSEDPQEKRKFERLIEKWHRSQTENKESINTARNRYVAIAQFFKFFDLELNTAYIPGEVKQTKISENDYPLTIEDVRAMYQAADLRGRAILLMAKDIGLRLQDFRWITVDQLPDLDAEPPIPFSVETRKEHVQTKSFLSAETVKILKEYVKTMKDRQCSYCRGRGCKKCNGKGKRADSPFLWPSNGTHPLDEDSFGLWLKNLARKAGVKTGNQNLTFHCFRRLLMRAAIETGVGLTAAKLMVGKAVAKSDETYIQKAKLDEPFKKLSKYLSITGFEASDNRDVEKTVVAQQREISDLKETVGDLGKRLEILTKEMDRIKVRHTYENRTMPTGNKLTDKEVDAILEAEKKGFRKLKDAGLVYTGDGKTEQK
jgi:integrase